MIDHRLVQLSSKEQELSNKWFQLLEARMNQNQYWTIFVPIFFIASMLYALNYSLDMPFGYNLPADWLWLTGALAWYLNRKNAIAKAWELLALEGESYAFSQVKSQLTRDILSVRQSLFYGVILGFIWFFVYLAAMMLNNILPVDTWLMVLLALVLGQASSFLHRYLYNKRIGSDLKLLDTFQVGLKRHNS